MNSKISVFIFYVVMTSVFEMWQLNLNLNLKPNLNWFYIDIPEKLSKNFNTILFLNKTKMSTVALF
jgi:hypothetical protein